MTKKTILITGATGFLGRAVLKAFQDDNNANVDDDGDAKKWEIYGQGFSREIPETQILKVDLTKDEDVEWLIGFTKPDVVIHCAANRYPDLCEANPELTRALNVAATSRLAHLTAAQSSLLIYISTDYVFAGRPGEAPYEADATTEPPNLYGLSKRDGEVAVLDATADKEGGGQGMGVVLRVPVLYGKAETTAESAVNVLIDAVWRAQDSADKGVVKMDHWAKRYPTNIEDVARVVRDVVGKYVTEGKGNALPRILQFSSEDCMTKYEICEAFAEILGLGLEGGMVGEGEPGKGGPGPQRPFNTHLSTRALREIGIDVTTQDFRDWWRRELRAFRH
ncbi:hypothetical protein AJ80_09285 [Polytolypa hystricis UAMH7299]|uniref:RmlD-like substrate binding domain-containing protein n=1 Tax=Polytolypa hystricis (strain UAMH7299) TaxID=1447883 RepID=A0A2B7WT81_POLH7|nr:hypothetical protein AJ80_09285 [Polytolypa hystricis UAMH7299]